MICRVLLFRGGNAERFGGSRRKKKKKISGPNNKTHVNRERPVNNKERTLIISPETKVSETGGVRGQGMKIVGRAQARSFEIAFPAGGKKKIGGVE